MKAFRLILLLIVGAFVLYVRLTTDTPSSGNSAPSSNAPAAQSSEDPTSSQTETDGAIPKKAYEVLAIIRSTGQPPEGYVGGRVFQNREHRLPADGDYREFDVDPHNGQRNAERIIVEWNTKKAWYTGDHYRTFLPLP